MSYLNYITEEAYQDGLKRGLKYIGFGRFVDKNNKVVAKTIDGKLVTIPGFGFDIPRHKMPQIHKQHKPAFFDYMRQKGVKVEDMEIPAKNLKATQSQFNFKSIKQIADSGYRDGSHFPIVSGDHFILDGHHRWLGAYNIDPDKKIKVHKVHTDIHDLVAMSHDFPHVNYKNINEEMIAERMAQIGGRDAAGTLYRVDYLRDPNAKELLDFLNDTKVQLGRFYMNDKHAFVWDAYKLNHNEFFDLMKMKVDNIAPKTVIYAWEVRKALEANAEVSAREILQSVNRPRSS